MECAEARKKLREYVSEEISDEKLRFEIEAHAAGCAVCKQEIYMWQEVLDRQTAVAKMQDKLPKELKDRIKYRMARNQKDPNMPPQLKRIQAFMAGRGTLIVLFLLICAALIYIFIFAKLKSGIVGPMLIFSGFAILFLLMLFRGNKKP